MPKIRKLFFDLKGVAYYYLHPQDQRSKLHVAFTWLGFYTQQLYGRGGADIETKPGSQVRSIWEGSW